MFGISPMQLIIILVIIILLFGTKKLRSLGGDLGSAVKGFKKAVSDDEKEDKDDADFPPKAKVESKSDTTSTVNQHKTETDGQKERN